MRPPDQPGVYALQALTDQEMIAGHDAPYARLSRELITRASTVRALACDLQRTLQNIHKHHQHCNVQPGANACWALASENGHDTYCPARDAECYHMSVVLL